MVRTSISHPLLIDSVSCASGAIGLTFCPGKKGSSVFGEPWARDLGADLRTLVAWGPIALVTLMEEHELQQLGAGGLGEAAELLGLEWHHLPIQDLGAPDERFERLWTYSGHVLRAHLRAGRRIVIHCRGGRGRTGLLAARLMVELGEDPRRAVTQVRGARDGAIETPAQLAHVLAQKPLQQNPGLANRVLGCLFGGAVGDAFGYAVEFQSLADIRLRHGPNGLIDPIYQAGRLVVSDDTQMTLFTAEGLARSAFLGEFTASGVTDSLRSAYLQWLATQQTYGARPTHGLARFQELWARRAPGNTCLSALRLGGRGSPDRPINDSKGCGAVMRTAPLGLMQSVNSECAFELGALAGALTHGHPSGYLSAGAMAAIVREAIGGRTLVQACEVADRLLAPWRGSDETRRAVRQALDLVANPDVAPDQAVLRLGQGWVGEEALAIGIYAAARADSLADALRVAANHDGDSDSTASIAGQIWGAMHGLGSRGHPWIRRLDVLDAICEASAEVLKLGDRPRNHKWSAAR